MTTKRRNGTPRHIRNQRTHWSHLIATTTIICRRCGNQIQPGDQWDLGHSSELPYAKQPGNTQNLAPECRTCNRSGYQATTPPAFTGWPT